MTGNGVVRRLRADDQIIALGILAHVLAFFCIPALHSLGHRDDHRHVAGGTEIVALHYHDGGPGGDADHAPAPSHGSGSVEHLDVAPLALTPFLLPPPSADAVELRAPVARSVFLGRIEDDTRAPRGPPRA